MPRTKKSPDTRNGHARSKGHVRGRNGPTTKAQVGEPLLKVDVRREGLQQFREAKEELTEIVRLAKEARRELEELRQAARERGQPAHAEESPRKERKDRPHKEDRAAKSRNRLGVTVGNGVVVAEVLPDSPAAHAGVARGDVIEIVNGTPILSATELRDAVHRAEADADAVLRVVRAGHGREIRTRLGAAGEREGADGHKRLGVTAGTGLIVADVIPESPAAKAGLRSGDLIDEVNGAAVVSGEQLRDLVRKLPPGTDVAVRLTRAGKQKEVKVLLNGGEK
jgi:predicted metalloprotease with PDZ domain